VPADLAITNVRFAEAPDGQQRFGLLGYVRFVLADAVAIDGVALRRTRDDRFVLSFPTRRDARGGQHAVVRPISSAVRAAIENEVFLALGIKAQGAS